MFGTSDTIAAIATAPGDAGLAIVRISGPQAASIASVVFWLGKVGGAFDPNTVASHTVHYGRVVSPTSGEPVDEAMLTWMASPRTFTTEDTVEIACHGGAVVSSAVLRAVIAAGARPAEPGEFTLRAFLNGRIDLTEAEAVLNVVSAQTSDALDRALADLRGDLSRRVAPARAAVVAALAYLDASADFPDDEITVSDISADLEAAVRALESVLAGATSGRLLREGAVVALVGRPNVGKSSLLNALLRSDRSIVTDVAGTTRDVVSEHASICGIPVTLLDTAGIVETGDPVEYQGVLRSHAAIERASAVVLVLDGSVAISHDDREIARALLERFSTGLVGAMPVVLAVNKCDLAPAIDAAQISGLLPGVGQVVTLSATSGAGLADLERAIATTLGGGHGAAVAPAMLTARQHAELDRALLHLTEARDALEAGFPTDVLATDVRAASRAIGRITGEDIDESVLAEIFSRFCIGK